MVVSIAAWVRRWEQVRRVSARRRSVAFDARGSPRDPSSQRIVGVRGRRRAGTGSQRRRSLASRDDSPRCASATDAGGVGPASGILIAGEALGAADVEEAGARRMAAGLTRDGSGNETQACRLPPDTGKAP
jgi:hypothetical protein